MDGSFRLTNYTIRYRQYVWLDFVYLVVGKITTFIGPGGFFAGVVVVPVVAPAAPPPRPEEKAGDEAKEQQEEEQLEEEAGSPEEGEEAEGRPVVPCSHCLY